MCRIHRSDIGLKIVGLVLAKLLGIATVDNRDSGNVIIDELNFKPLPYQPAFFKKGL